jgi:hypothetical protein
LRRQEADRHHGEHVVCSPEGMQEAAREVVSMAGQSRMRRRERRHEDEGGGEKGTAHGKPLSIEYQAVDE